MAQYPLALILLTLLGCPSPDDTHEPVAVHPHTPPPWLWQAQHLTVAPDRGLVFEIDEDFEIVDRTVPQLYVLPDGRFGMLVTRMGSSEEHWARTVLYSDDGLTWTDGEPLLWPDDFEQNCGNRLQDGAVWIQDEQTYRFVMEGFYDQAKQGEQPLEETFLCHGTTTDGASFELSDDYFWTGELEDECNSVLSALTLESGLGLFFYNGDLTRLSDEGPGIRAFTADPETLAIEVQTPAPLLPWYHVDPNPLFLEGGGLRLYHTWFAEEHGGPLAGTGLGAVDLDEDLNAIGEPVLVLEAIGDEQEGDKPMDPTLLQLSDGRLVLYYTSFVREPGVAYARIRRAFAVD